MSLSIAVWSDIACPWCWVGKKRLETALKQLADQGVPVDAEITYHSFELDQRKKDATDKTPYVNRLANKYGFSVSKAQGLVDNMTQTGKGEGIAFDFARAVPANTFDAHRLLHWARSSDEAGATKGAQAQLKEAFMKAHFEQGVDIGQAADLLSVVDTVGLDVDGAAAVLAGDRFASEVREDEAEAQALGITGVPFFAVERFGVGGAQQPQVFVDLIKRLLAEQLEEERERQGKNDALDEGALCTPETC